MNRANILINRLYNVLHAFNWMENGQIWFGQMHKKERSEHTDSDYNYYPMQKWAWLEKCGVFQTNVRSQVLSKIIQQFIVRLFEIYQVITWQPIKRNRIAAMCH